VSVHSGVFLMLASEEQVNSSWAISLLLLSLA